MKKQKIEKRPTRARRAVKSVVIMLCALLICNMLGGGHLTRAMANSATAYMKRRTRLHPFPPRTSIRRCASR